MSLDNDINRTLDLFRDVLAISYVLAISLLFIAAPIIIFGYIGVLPESLAPEIFLGFIGLSTVYFAIDKLIEKYLKDSGFEVLNNLNHGKLLEKLDKD